MRRRPGTIALRLGQPLYQVDYSAVISKYLGDTAKHIAACFKRASELGAVLFEWEGRPATLSFLIDITARKRAEETLVIAERHAAVGQLAAGVVVLGCNLAFKDIVGFVKDADKVDDAEARARAIAGIITSAPSTIERRISSAMRFSLTSVRNPIDCAEPTMIE